MMVDLTELGISMEQTQLAIDTLADVPAEDIFEGFDERVARFVCAIKALSTKSKDK